MSSPQEQLLAEFAAWVATNRAFNGSDHHPHAQGLYNECINAVLPEWAAEFARERGLHCEHDWIEYGNGPEADDRWRECFLCGAMQPFNEATP